VLAVRRPTFIRDGAVLPRRAAPRQPQRRGSLQMRRPNTRSVLTIWV
jgi:hypothetical protein